MHQCDFLLQLLYEMELRQKCQITVEGKISEVGPTMIKNAPPSPWKQCLLQELENQLEEEKKKGTYRVYPPICDIISSHNMYLVS